MSDRTLSTISDDSVAAQTASTNADVTSASSAPAEVPPPAPPKPAYVPPHLRSAPRTPSTTAANSYTHTHTHAIPQQYFTTSAIFAHYGVQHGGTINASINNHRELAYILVFLNQHPEYPEKIFVKSSLDLIFRRQDGEELNPLLKELLIPLFEEMKPAYKTGDCARPFRFRGWVRVAGAKRLLKGSDELIAMLTKKWRKDAPRRGAKAMTEREREQRRIDAGEATIVRTVEKDANGAEVVVEHRFFKDDIDDEVDAEEKAEKEKAEEEVGERKRGRRKKLVEGSTVDQKLGDTLPRTETAWKNSLGVDWAVVELEFVNCDRGNPMHGPPVKLTAPAFVDFDDEKWNEKPAEGGKTVGNAERPFDTDILELMESATSISLSTVGHDEEEEADKGKKKDTGPARLLGLDGADDTVMVNDDLDSASIPSSPVLEPATPKKGSAVNLSTYALAKSWDDGGLRLPDKNGQALAVSSEDISASYMSAGASSVADDFAAMSANETDAEESDRWSELSEHDREEEHWMAVERGGMAKEVF
ncbi:hypothetical protein TWF696_004363 [Orbilia brochopaga]|uniref:Uncharacterized protein n=1 Tax=Orbilia brochopaga TaxID=3140254 RepID=A0AAV9V653_9PEZI